MTNPMAALARELIQIPTVADQDAGRPSAACLFRCLHDVGLDPVADVVSENAANVSCVVDTGLEGPTFCSPPTQTWRLLAPSSCGPLLHSRAWWTASPYTGAGPLSVRDG
jgi:hypothetical protein